MSKFSKNSLYEVASDIIDWITINYGDDDAARYSKQFEALFTIYLQNLLKNTNLHSQNVTTNGKF